MSLKCTPHNRSNMSLPPPRKTGKNRITPNPTPPFCPMGSSTCEFSTTPTYFRPCQGFPSSRPKSTNDSHRYPSRTGRGAPPGLKVQDPDSKPPRSHNMKLMSRVSGSLGWLALAAVLILRSATERDPAAPPCSSSMSLMRVTGDG